MKEKLLTAASRYTVLNVAFLPVLVILRVIQHFLLAGTPDPPEHPFLVELIGLIHDLFAFSMFSMIFFIPFYFIFGMNKKAGNIFYITFLCIIGVLEVIFVKYLSITLIPLDEVIYSFSLKENLLIIRSSDVLNFMTFLPMIMVVGSVIGFQYLLRKWRPGKFVLFFSSGFIFATILVIMILPTSAAKDEVEFDHFRKINKCGYFVKQSVIMLFNNLMTNQSNKISSQIRDYHDIHKEFTFIDDRYPLLHQADTPDALGPFFNTSPKPPNLVFIIVESLSSACIGNQSWFGNFTPFLDSLKDHSLYWDNFLSTSERTFHVLPGLFGSVPYGQGEFQKDVSVIPNHNSLIRYLRENGYYSSFYYGGDPSFTNYDQYLKKEGLDFLLRNFGSSIDKKQLEYQNFRWGYHDECLFQRSLEMLDSLKKEPRLDIYLTLSTHYPFIPPNAKHYQDEFTKIIQKPDFPTDQKRRAEPFKNLFSSVLYTDDALRAFFREYAKRSDFKNTIFIITGDHCFTEFGNASISAIEKYHVPLIIYSPLLKEDRHFHSVSSHLDVTPSLVAMLQSHYHFKSEKFTHWLGQGIDTTMEYRNIHTMVFANKSNKTEDYLKNDYYYSSGKLFRLTDGLKTVVENDEMKRKEMNGELFSSSAVYEFTNKKNLLLPPESYLPTKTTRQWLLSVDTANLKMDAKKFLSIIRPLGLNKDYFDLNVKLSLQFRIEELKDTNNIPELIATIEDNQFKQFLYHKTDFPSMKRFDMRPNRWYNFEMEETLSMDQVENLKGKYLKLYFFTERVCQIQFGRIKVEISGTKL